MNTNQLKKFAQDARKKLLEQVGAKLSFVLTTDSSELREKANQVSQLQEELSRTGKAQLIEKVAYTWFNRLMALRFMDVNDYQPLGIRVITPKDGYTTPELLDEAKRGNIPDELKLKRQKVYDLLDNRIPSINPQNEAYKELLIAACNHLNTVFPFLFEKINDYTELLIPDDLTSDFSIVTDVREGMPIEDCSNVEIIGWLYQFYISEKKDEVFASKSVVKKEDIPAATQLFTPRWIVEYMVQNTVGKLWLQNRPKSRLREYMPYLIESSSLTTDNYLKISSPEEIKLADPSSGSGHILVYAFDLFTKIYEEEGYNTNDIPKLIIEKNLYGFEIDERAAQLSGLALMMKAREYQRRALRKEIIPNILCFQDLLLTTNEIKQIFDTFKIKVNEEILHDLINMQQATNFGSLIIPKASLSEIVHILKRFNELKSSSDVFQRNAIDSIQIALNQLIRLAGKFHCVAANPPYMGNGNMNKELSKFVNKNYPDSKSDLMTCFMEASLEMIMNNGILGMINLPSWLFLSSFEKLRIKLINNKHFDSLLHMGRGIFGIDWGSTAFIILNQMLEVNGRYFKLHKRNFQHIYSNDIRDIFIKAKNEVTTKINFDKYRDDDGIKSVDDLVDNDGLQIAYYANQNDFKKIPSCPIGYWLSSKAVETFNKFEILGLKSEVRTGLDTGNNNQFVRDWFEISLMKSTIKNDTKCKKWYPYNNGGGYRKWYGNNNLVVNWENKGEAIHTFNKVPINYNGAPVRAKNFYFRSGITFGKISSKGFTTRLCDSGFIFSSGGSMIFSDINLKLILAFTSSKVAQYYLNVFNPTLNNQVGDILRLPIGDHYSNDIINISDENVYISKLDWDAKEISWDFIKNELIRIKAQDIEESYDLYQQYWKNKFFQLHKNEEELNRHFIEIYGLQEELTPEVSLDDITILKEETLIENSQLVFKSNEVFAQFISYAVGCMFGRYSLDKDGLVLANKGETLQDYLHKIDKTAYECSFLPDEDNIIPVLDDEWFEDDITGRFYQFLKVSFGEKNFNKNLQFIEEQLGKDIRKYFTKDFYPDHIKRYKKRPIYWMFSSPKGSFNVLIYSHRYTPDTVSNILNKYLKEFIGKLKTRKETLQHTQVNGSASEKTKAIKENDNIEKMLIELHEYERDVLFPLATERIAIDLDDGVLVNYNKFGKAVKEVTGLNDKAIKKKVKEFDWIDITQIK